MTGRAGVYQFHFKTNGTPVRLNTSRIVGNIFETRFDEFRWYDALQPRLNELIDHSSLI